ncbi:5-formyltetrahydrofolate cyclo-ligase [Mangrovimonas cancribranchiae]|uniref:5-formyltetrahydrofolate cyclo-ligase n=1 Tax=Mangrovimonas cancribranchiae TaxID=3080055 RepID=A0AAU6P6T8_9FLAO
MASKAELRKAYKQKRQALSASQLDDLSLDIANQLLKLDIWDYTYYHIFLSIAEQREVNTDYILNVLSGKDKNIIISKSDFKTFEMTHVLLTDATVIKKNHYNIPEPVDGIDIPNAKIEVVFVPLLAFDKQGHRVGYGKGFYDKFLSKCRPNTLKIGVSFFEAEDRIENTFKNDIPLDYCVTPKQVYRF